MKKLPLGIRSFEQLRDEGCLYVDKTEDVLQLTESHFVFLTRPRRFGKSLLVSTLEELYKGNKRLFEGLYIYDKWDWTWRYPVIRIDWACIKHGSGEEIERSTSTFLKQQANLHEINLVSDHASGMFSELIVSLHHKTGNKVVMLIDGYDTPIVDTMGQPEAEAVREFLQSFYSIIKASDDHMRFTLLTGVTNAKVSVFSILNMDDITTDYRHASICGYTQEELEGNFSEYIDETASHLEMTREDVLYHIRRWYDGYSWDGKTSVYNPFAILMLLKHKEFSNYWFETGTHTFLINRLKEHGRAETVLEPVIADSTSLVCYNPDAFEAIPLLFQTGYLTVKDTPKTDGVHLYTLGIPNLEVRKSLMELLLSAFTQYPVAQLEGLGKEMLQQICDYDAEGFTNNMRKMLAGVPLNLKTSKWINRAKAEAENAEHEAHYHIIFQMWMTMLGFNIQNEKITSRGRIDAVLQHDGVAIVVELKYHVKTNLKTLLNQAIAQIHEKRYYEPFLDRKVILLGIAFSGKKVGCKLEQLTV
ncbi:hypothetical protein SAMD00024442_4_77 [Candidatus Symbiothrix dinenymphae]|nr:hypothetical protein SAMD00024442_4_77 [Candidatus Symbiothrix dinenymphae]